VSLARDLLRAEWRARRSAYVAMALLLAGTSATSLLVLSSVDGLESGIGREISATLGGDVRVTKGHTGVGDGVLVENEDDIITGLSFDAPGARFSARLETEAIFLHGSDFTSAQDADNASRAAAILVGVDGARDARVVRLGDYVTQGVTPEAAPAYRTPQGDPLVPLLVGEEFLRGGNLTVANGSFAWSSVFNVTAGHVENGQLVRFRGIVVGAYETGFRMIDRLVVYAPRGDVARLLGHFPTKPSANAILVAAPDPHAVALAARARGLEAIEAPAFRESYLGPVLVAVRATAWIIGGALTLLTAAWIARTLAHQVHADRQRIATLRAIGVPEEAFARLYRTIALALGGVGGALGVAAAWLVGALVTLAVRALGSRLPTPEPRLWEALALILLSALTAMLAAQGALARVRRVPIRTALESPAP